MALGNIKWCAVGPDRGLYAFGPGHNTRCAAWRAVTVLCRWPSKIRRGLIIATGEWGLSNVRFSNRPFGVKHFQTIHLCGFDVARGLALLFGIGTKALPSWDSKMRWNNL